MSAAFDQLLTLMPIPSKDRSIILDGFSALLGMGWPINYIDWKMCVRAFAGLVPPYEGTTTWTAYKREWAWADTKKQDQAYAPLLAAAEGMA